MILNGISSPFTTVPFFLVCVLGLKNKIRHGFLLSCSF